MAEFVRAGSATASTASSSRSAATRVEDAARVEAVLRVTDGREVLVADANGGYSFADALAAARRSSASTAFTSSSRAGRWTSAYGCGR